MLEDIKRGWVPKRARADGTAAVDCRAAGGGRADNRGKGRVADGKAVCGAAVDVPTAGGKAVGGTAACGTAAGGNAASGKAR